MEMDMRELTFADLCHGAVEEQFRDAISEIVADMSDLNTNPDKVRTITVKIGFMPTPDRTAAQYSAVVSVSLPSKPQVKSTVYLRRDNGRMKAFEHCPMDLPFGDDGRVIKIGGKDRD